jgi:hypothetical protein
VTLVPSVAPSAILLPKATTTTATATTTMKKVAVINFYGLFIVAVVGVVVVEINVVRVLGIVVVCCRRSA